MYYTSTVWGLVTNAFIYSFITRYWYDMRMGGRVIGFVCELVLWVFWVRGWFSVLYECDMVPVSYRRSRMWAVVCRRRRKVRYSMQVDGGGEE